MKDETINAINQLIENYKKGIKSNGTKDCPLCKIHHKEIKTINHKIYDCGTCPSNSVRDSVFTIYKGMLIGNAQGCYCSESYYNLCHSKNIREFIIRQCYWEKRLPLLKKLDKKYFTKEGYGKAVFKNIMK